MNRPKASAPLSPHLQIWRFTPTMAASITQRATGVANFSGTLVLAAWAFAAARGEAWFGPVAGFLASPVGQLIVFGYIWSLCFHMIGGLRYLYTDTGKGLEPKIATQAAIANYAGSIILTLLIAGAAFAARAS
ncbi:MAG: succinate dehydrogenase, cytochrome b556 subunit [Alphaproteobacteria bacterium]|nr:succinate dehydrogenase, cytochrome b556 subunit [Alphaproteobacteria bacterium]